MMFAESGRRTLVIEGDLRHPKLSDYLGLERSVGLSNVLAGQVDVDEVLQQWGDGPLVVLSGGTVPPNPSEMLGSHGMTELMERLRTRFDTIIIDTPPLLPVTDAAVASVHADGVVIVVRAGRTTRAQLATAIASLRAVDARIFGTILNMVSLRRGNRAAYERYGYPDQTARPTVEETPPVRVPAHPGRAREHHASRSEATEGGKDDQGSGNPTGRPNRRRRSSGRPPNPRADRPDSSSVPLPVRPD
jgi:capsular exopolysaccharide synthesis family protein